MINSPKCASVYERCDASRADVNYACITMHNIPSLYRSKEMLYSIYVYVCTCNSISRSQLTMWAICHVVSLSFAFNSIWSSGDQFAKGNQLERVTCYFASGFNL